MTQDSAQAPILLTGASGFIAMHTTVHLLRQGYRVRGTLRSLAKEAQLREVIARHVDPGDRLEFAVADLDQDNGWAEAAAGCDFVLHLASPFPTGEPADPEELIRPAVDGTLRVLRAALVAGVRRVVFLSSTAAVSIGHFHQIQRFDESHWSNLAAPIGAYSKSKTLAEQAAWDFVQSPENGGRLELVSLNPPYVYGPPLDDHAFTSGDAVLAYLRGAYPGAPHIKLAFVDVRDLAAMFEAALLTPAAAGQRFLCTGETPWLAGITAILHRQFASRGYRVPTRELPNWLVKLVARFDKRVRGTVPYLDWDYTYDSSRARAVLGWNPRPPEDTLRDMGEAMIKLGMV